MAIFGVLLELAGHPPRCWASPQFSIVMLTIGIGYVARGAHHHAAQHRHRDAHAARAL
jgi:hypothetical protein